MIADVDRSDFAPRGGQRIAGKTIRPRNGLVLVKEHDIPEEKTKGGIVIPVKVGNKGVLFATITSIGTGRYLENGDRAVLSDLKIGDIVLVQSERGMPLSVEDAKRYLLNESDILAVIED